MRQDAFWFPVTKNITCQPCGKLTTGFLALEVNLCNYSNLSFPTRSSRNKGFSSEASFYGSDQMEGRQGKAVWEERFYCSQLCLLLGSASQSQLHPSCLGVCFLPLPAPSWRNPMSGSLVTGAHQKDYILGTEGRRE